MSVAGSSEYSLTLEDVQAFRALLGAQGNLGPGRKQYTQSQFWDFFGQINVIAYRLTSNAHVKNWTDQLISVLVNTQTCYGFSATGLYILYMYHDFIGGCFTPGSEFEPVACGLGFPKDWEGRGQWPTWDNSKGLSRAWPWNWLASAVGLWKPPANPASFFAKINSEVNAINDSLQVAKGSTPFVALRSEYTMQSLLEVQQFEQLRFDPTNWTDSAQFVTNIAAAKVWQEQSQMAANLLKPDVLAGDAYFFLLHVLIGLCASKAEDQHLAQQIVSASTSSHEYPNDTFINHLVYLTLLYLINPKGSYHWDSDQLKSFLADMQGVLPGNDPGSTAIKASLTGQAMVLNSTPGYPMVDPYNPNKNPNERISDTLAALDAARAALSKTSNVG